MAQTFTTILLWADCSTRRLFDGPLHPEEPHTINTLTYMSNLLPMTIHLFNKIDTTILLGYLIDFIRFSTQCTPNTLHLVLSDLNNYYLLSFVTGKPKFLTSVFICCTPTCIPWHILWYLTSSSLGYVTKCHPNVNVSVLKFCQCLSGPQTMNQDLNHYCHLMMSRTIPSNR